MLVSCDDPSSWSSQNEQDNRIIAMAAYLPVIEPCNVPEAKEVTKYAFEFSELYGQPVMLRSTTRVSHAVGDVMLGEVARLERRAEWERRPDLLIYDSACARRNRQALLRRFERIKEAVNDFPFNELTVGDPGEIGIVTPGVSYVYVREAIRALTTRSNGTL